MKLPTVSELQKEKPCLQCQPHHCNTFRQRFSLTRELQRGGCAHYYLNRTFPKLARFVRSLNLPKGTVLTEAPRGWESFAGTAFDRRLRYQYEPDYTDSVIDGGIAKLSAHESLNGYDVHKGLKDSNLTTRSLYAALADTAFRNFQAGLDSCYAFFAGGGGLQEALCRDIEALLRIAETNLPLFAPVFGPTFGAGSVWIGGADADIVDEGFLLDIKAVKSVQKTGFIRQVIAYALLDVDNLHQLDSVGVYLARQGILWRLPLSDLEQYADQSIEALRDQAPWGKQLEDAIL